MGSRGVMATFEGKSCRIVYGEIDNSLILRILQESYVSNVNILPISIAIPKLNIINRS
jgi:hypothetical protein